MAVNRTGTGRLSRVGLRGREWERSRRKTVLLGGLRDGGAQLGEGSLEPIQSTDTLAVDEHLGKLERNHFRRTARELFSVGSTHFVVVVAYSGVARLFHVGDTQVLEEFMGFDAEEACRLGVDFNGLDIREREGGLRGLGHWSSLVGLEIKST